ncbi:EVE domain-containing protein [Starkeya koreensis]|uniref:EVE domain-containing protein n=1 Tax=Ancylobacter koreensis TaxID=266121 RepID=A0ABT0DLT8_9HYPH|nr:EVE domain-containing protein [Ancylobacter koreensis]MCK0208243.1 EVE domain-containing protein [Ancylobacter koreensis]
MAHWLYKSEPFKWSWEMQLAAGAKGTHWDGVRNHLAKQQLLAMKTGEHGFFYHSNEGKEIVGIVEVIREAYPDPSDPSGKFVMVDLKAVATLKNPVTLAAVKAEPRLAEMALLKYSRLSVQPVTDAEWEIVLDMAGGTR